MDYSCYDDNFVTIIHYQCCEFNENAYFNNESLRFSNIIYFEYLTICFLTAIIEELFGHCKYYL